MRLILSEFRWVSADLVLKASIRDLHAAANGICQSLFVVVPGWDEFLGKEPVVACLSDRLNDRGVVEFLSFVEFIAAGASGSVIVSDVLSCPTDGGHDVTFHDLHVVDVIEKFEAV